MKVLHVINSLLIGGAEVLLVNSLSQHGLPRIMTNKIIYFQGDSSLLTKIDKSVEVFCLEYNNKFHLPSALLKLRLIINKIKPDIIHSHLNPAGLYTHLVCPNNIPHIHTMHIMYSADNYTREYLKLLERKLFLVKENANLIFLSSALENDFKSVVNFKGRSFILNNFVGEEYFQQSFPILRNTNSEWFRLMAIGLKEFKNHDFSIEVFKHLKDEKISLDIYGDENINVYKRKIDESGVNINLKGKANTLSDVFGNYDLFFMPSLFEGYPLSVLEAMATGTPVMVSDILPLRETAKDFGIYFSLENPADVAEKIIQLKNNRSELTQNAKAAWSYVNETGRLKNYISNLLKIYEDIL